MEEDEDVEPRGFFAFIKNGVETVPCLKNTMFYGLSTFVGTFLGVHGWTGRTRSALLAANGAFVLVSLGLFVPCNSRERAAARQYRQLEALLDEKGEAIANLAQREQEKEASLSQA